MTTSNRRLRGALALVLAMVLASGPAFAEPSAADLESARELYRDGKDLRQKGDLRGALERFKAAHRYGQTPVTALELGKTHLQLGELIEAREVLLSVARMKVASDETEKSVTARAEAAELADQIRPRIPTLVVKLSGVMADAAVEVVVDDAHAPVVSLAAMRKVNPGDHVVVVRAAGREEKRSVSVGEGETKEVPVVFNSKSPAFVDASADGTKATHRSVHPVTWIGLGFGVAGLAVGAVTGAIALGKATSVTDACRGLSCPGSARADVDDGRTIANVSTIAFAVGLAGVATAALGWFVLSPRKPAHVALTPTWGGLDVRF